MTTRKWLVRIIALLYLAQGLWDLGVFLSPIFGSSRPISLNYFYLIVGLVELIAGIGLFRLIESGRRLMIALLFLRIFINSYFISWALRQDNFDFAIKYFDKTIFQSSNSTVFVFALLMWLLIAVGALIFLNQKETKSIFVSRTINGEKENLLSESVSNK